MFMVKVVSSEKNLEFKGPKLHLMWSLWVRNFCEDPFC